MRIESPPPPHRSVWGTRRAPVVPMVPFKGTFFSYIKVSFVFFLGRLKKGLYKAP